MKRAVLHPSSLGWAMPAPGTHQPIRSGSTYNPLPFAARMAMAADRALPIPCPIAAQKAADAALKELDPILAANLEVVRAAKANVTQRREVAKRGGQG